MEDVIHTDGTLGRLRRSEVIGTVADFPTRRCAMQVLSQRLGSVNSGKARPQSIRTFGDFVKDDWMPVVLPTLKHATQKHYKYMLDVHLAPAFGKRQLRELSREELQSFLRKAERRVVMGDGPPLQMWPEQNSQCGRGMGLHHGERGSENETPTTAAWIGARCTDSGPGAEPHGCLE